VVVVALVKETIETHEERVRPCYEFPAGWLTRVRSPRKITDGLVGKLFGV
jgi:hypothetical protein